jgi:hypothetical protein
MSGRTLGIVLGMVWVAVWAGGCTKYEYQIVEPQSLARRVGSSTFERLEVPPLVFHLRTYENRLVMRVENPTSDPIQFLGDQSYVVSPNGESHPFRNETIAPGAFMKLVFPPVRPRLEGPLGPTFGIGVGYSTGRGGLRRGPGYYDDFEPRYLYVVDDGKLYWDWDGETDVRMSLVFKRGEQVFSQGFVIHRVKVK